MEIEINVSHFVIIVLLLSIFLFALLSLFTHESQKEESPKNISEEELLEEICLEKDALEILIQTPNSTHPWATKLAEKIKKNFQNKSIDYEKIKEMCMQIDKNL